MFTSDDRDRLRQTLIDRARRDPRVAAAAAVGSSARGGDRWSDLDLTFGVATGFALESVLADWTAMMERDFAAFALFDLPVAATIYRVFLLPGALQVDLSFSPAADFGPRGPRFALIFGETVEHASPSPPSPAYLFGLGVHHAVRAHICLARERRWQAEYWLHGTRDQALMLACQRRGLEPGHGRGFDALPANLREEFAGALPSNLHASELRRALAVATGMLLREGSDVPGARAVSSMLDEIRNPDAL